MSRQQGTRPPPEVQKPTPVIDVAVGYCHPETVSAFWHNSIVVNIMESGLCSRIIAVYSGPKVDAARNSIVRHWLDNTDCTHLFMVDTDMIVPPGTINRLVELDKDIVGGLCFAAEPTLSKVRPTIGVMRKVSEHESSIDTLWDYPLDTLVKCDATGAACMMIKREVAETMLKAKGKDHAMPWFAHGMHGNTPIGEDVAFCLTARKLGFEVWVDTGIEVGHVKPRFVGPQEYVLSMSKPDHPFHEQRETSPIYKEMIHGHASIDSN